MTDDERASKIWFGLTVPQRAEIVIKYAGTDDCKFSAAEHNWNMFSHAKKIQIILKAKT